MAPSSRPAAPNVFDSVNGSNPPIHTDFTNGALGNIPVLQPNHNFSTGAPASAAADLSMTSPPRGRDRGDAIMSSPSKDDAVENVTMSSPQRTRHEQRAAHNEAHLQQLEQEREHEERKAAAAREHELLLQGDRDYALGDFEPDEPADSAMNTTPTSTAPTDADVGNVPNSNPPADDNMDTEPTGTSSTDADMTNAPAGSATPAPSSEPGSTTPLGLFTPPVPHSTREVAYLRSRPYNESGAFDDIYRHNNYEEPDDYDESGEPIYLNPPRTRRP
ncbi:hypothetical protein M436DRAFT_83193 [Aureobasidium namibiae CBS 147.97]|uniref:Uncharacterized protein n=1 Tax=Aureobasidium namibiae CBS 147.97 TaxID=1043004 RepID=A0A074WJ00_9PEZI